MMATGVRPWMHVSFKFEIYYVVKMTVIYWLGVLV
jgi:hypothetical protein